MKLNQLKLSLGLATAEENWPEQARQCRQLLIDAISFIFEESEEKQPEQASLLELLDNPVIVAYVADADILRGLNYVRILGMNAEHGQNVRRKEAKVSLDGITNLISLIEKKHGGNEVHIVPPFLTEEETRRIYVDAYLREAGWEVLTTEGVPAPSKAGIEIEVTGMPNEHHKGYCDYVLYGKDGKPLAIVEVKKTTKSPSEGRHQVDLYGECMKAVYGYKPVLYYTNGYETKIIDGIYPDRPVIAFHTREELERILQSRNRKPMTDLKINNEITSRPYQHQCLTAICEAFNQNYRRGLLVMATGTGKTRVAISLVDILTRNRWVKNVLFLADRTTLVNQAKRNFAKLLPSMSICELSASGEKDLNARLMFCTYQTMINYIDAEDKVFTTGRFDLIIIDEAHRSIFNRYGSIFKYFDSFLVGLTATPKNEVDANTYQIFGCESGIPNFDYPLEEAIKDHYLVGYNVLNRSTKLMSEGIKYDELTDEQKAKLDDYFEDGDVPTPDFNIPGNELFKKIYNKETCQLVLEDLMSHGFRVNDGETMGKTIIFAYNHRHAQMIVDTFHELYPAYPANACQLVDYSVNYAENLVIKFDEDDEFRIAVSVDMLDTGVDVPAVLNLVFFKPVKSKIKFVQMIGRGTRLCENLLGNGRNKPFFIIFDYCGNFEYFSMNKDGASTKTTLTLSQRMFQSKVEILKMLQSVEHQSDPWEKAYYDSLKNELHGELVKLKGRGNRIQVRNEMAYVDRFAMIDSWAALSPADIKQLQTHIIPLIDSGLSGHYLSVAFDCRIYNIVKSVLAVHSCANAVADVKNVRQIAQYLLKEKASIPQVFEKKDELTALMGNDIWDNMSLKAAEAYRTAVRDLMPFLQDHNTPAIDIDIADSTVIKEPVTADYSFDIRTYKEKVLDYLAEHSDNPVIQKIKNIEPITTDDLNELERILWTELGSKEDYQKESKTENLAAFVRSLVGISQEAVNEKFGAYLNGNIFNSQQQEFVKTIISYVRENGDIVVDDLINTDPFNNYDLSEIFGEYVLNVAGIVNLLHNVIDISVA